MIDMFRHTGNGIVKGLLGKVASLIRCIQNLVVEDGEVKGKTQADRVGGRKLSLGNLGGSLVSLERLVGRVLAAVANGEFGKVTVVVTLPAWLLVNIHAAEDWKMSAHLVVEDLGLARLGGRNQVLVENLEDILADLGKLGLDLLAVLLDESDLGRVALRLLLLLNRGDYSPRGTAGANDVLVGNGEEVSLLNGEVAVLRSNNLHVLNHLCNARLQSTYNRNMMTAEVS